MIKILSVIAVLYGALLTLRWSQVQENQKNIGYVLKIRWETGAPDSFTQEIKVQDTDNFNVPITAGNMHWVLYGTNEIKPDGLMFIRFNFQANSTETIAKIPPSSKGGFNTHVIVKLGAPEVSPGGSTSWSNGVTTQKTLWISARRATA